MRFEFKYLTKFTKYIFYQKSMSQSKGDHQNYIYKKNPQANSANKIQNIHKLINQSQQNMNPDQQNIIKSSKKSQAQKNHSNSQNIDKKILNGLNKSERKSYLNFMKILGSDLSNLQSDQKTVLIEQKAQNKQEISQLYGNQSTNQQIQSSISQNQQIYQFNQKQSIQIESGQILLDKRQHISQIHYNQSNIQDYERQYLKINEQQPNTKHFEQQLNSENYEQQPNLEHYQQQLNQYHEQEQNLKDYEQQLDFEYYEQQRISEHQELQQLYLESYEQKLNLELQNQYQNQYQHQHQNQNQLISSTNMTQLDKSIYYQDQIQINQININQVSSVHQLSEKPKQQFQKMIIQIDQSNVKQNSIHKFQQSQRIQGPTSQKQQNKIDQIKIDQPKLIYSARQKDQIDRLIKEQKNYYQEVCLQPVDQNSNVQIIDYKYISQCYPTNSIQFNQDAQNKINFAMQIQIDQPTHYLNQSLQNNFYQSNYLNRQLQIDQSTNIKNQYVQTDVIIEHVDQLKVQNMSQSQKSQKVYKDEVTFNIKLESISKNQALNEQKCHSMQIKNNLNPIMKQNLQQSHDWQHKKKQCQSNRSKDRSAQLNKITAQIRAQKISASKKNSKTRQFQQFDDQQIDIDRKNDNSLMQIQEITPQHNNQNSYISEKNNFMCRSEQSFGSKGSNKSKASNKSEYRYNRFIDTMQVPQLSILQVVRQSEGKSARIQRRNSTSSRNSRSASTCKKSYDDLTDINMHKIQESDCEEDKSLKKSKNHQFVNKSQTINQQMNGVNQQVQVNTLKSDSHNSKKQILQKWLNQANNQDNLQFHQSQSCPIQLEIDEQHISLIKNGSQSINNNQSQSIINNGTQQLSNNRTQLLKNNKYQSLKNNEYQSLNHNESQSIVNVKQQNQLNQSDQMEIFKQYEGSVLIQNKDQDNSERQIVEIMNLNNEKPLSAHKSLLIIQNISNQLKISKLTHNRITQVSFEPVVDIEQQFQNLIMFYKSYLEETHDKSTYQKTKFKNSLMRNFQILGLEITPTSERGLKLYHDGIFACSYISYLKINRMSVDSGIFQFIMYNHFDQNVKIYTNQDIFRNHYKKVIQEKQMNDQARIQIMFQKQQQKNQIVKKHIKKQQQQQRNKTQLKQSKNNFKRQSLYHILQHSQSMDGTITLQSNSKSDRLIKKISIDQNQKPFFNNFNSGDLRKSTKFKPDFDEKLNIASLKISKNEQQQIQIDKNINDNKESHKKKANIKKSASKGKNKRAKGIIKNSKFSVAEKSNNLKSQGQNDDNDEVQVNHRKITRSQVKQGQNSNLKNMSQSKEVNIKQQQQTEQIPLQQEKVHVQPQRKTRGRKMTSKAQKTTQQVRFSVESDSNQQTQKSKQKNTRAEKRKSRSKKN